MNKAILIAGLVIFGLNLMEAQEKVKWYTIDEAMQLSSEEPRVLVIDDRKST